jgi:hypothetical protein
MLERGPADEMLALEKLLLCLGAPKVGLIDATSGDVGALGALLDLPASLDTPLAPNASFEPRVSDGVSLSANESGAPPPSADLVMDPGAGRPDLPADGIPEYLGLGRLGVGNCDMILQIWVDAD